MRRFLVLCWACLMFTAGVLAQSAACPNSGFETGTFAGWTGGTGSCCPIVINNNNLVNDRHTITSGPGMDPRTNNMVSVVAPDGGQYSARLGNWDVNSEAERLQYVMNVTEANALFVYRYAVVLEDPAHDASDQPRFEIRMYDQAGNNIECGMYNVYAANNIPGFTAIVNSFGDDVVYKDWTTVGMDLTDYLGQDVTIEFRTGDCDQGEHYGYAYVDYSCGPRELTSNFCPGLLTTTLQAPSGFASYLWSTGETTPSIVIDNPTTGQTVSCVITSVTGCTAVITAVLEPSSVLAGIDYVGDCMNAVQFTDASTVLIGSPIVAWHWTFDGGAGGTSTEQNPFHSFGSPGLHEVELAIETEIGCVDTLTIEIDLIPAPVADFVTSPVCFGEATVFEDMTPVVNGVLERRWDLGDGTLVEDDAVVEHIYGSMGTYNVELYVEDINGCHDSVTVQVTVSPFPEVDLGEDIAVCADVPVQLDAGNPGATFLWNTGAAGQTLTVTAAGTYSVLVVNSSGCEAVDSVDVVLHPLPEIALPDTALCVEQTLPLDAGNPGSTYLWSTGATTQQIVLSGTSGSHSIAVTTSMGCTVTDLFDVTFHPSVAVDLGPDQLLCASEVAVLHAAAPPLTCLWNTGETTQSIQATTTGTYHVTVTNGYCVGTDSVDMVFSALPTVNLRDTTLCVESILVADAGNAGSSFLWSTGATTQSITISLQSGNYAVTVTNTDGCSSTADMDVLFMPSIAVDLGPDSVLCEGGVVSLDVTTPGATYLWDNGATTPDMVVTEDRIVTVHVTNQYCQDSDQAAFTFLPYPLHTLPMYVYTCFDLPGASVTLTAGGTGTWYEWSTGETTRSITISELGTYTLRSTSPPGCTIEEVVEVLEDCPPGVFVPNAFTPNSDGINDGFMPIAFGVKWVRLEIFNRWGESIFDSREEKGWNGTYKGELVQDGVYNWRFTFAPLRDQFGTGRSEETVTGHVTVLR